MTNLEILNSLPFSKPFLFVDEILQINETGVTGEFRFKEELDFYKGHFKNNPVTPGVILTECMAQIGVASLGIYLLQEKNKQLQDCQIAMSSTKIHFFLPVFPNEKVRVTSKKEYFRFNKLCCKVAMFNQKEQLVCRGKISGMIKSEK